MELPFLTLGVKTVLKTGLNSQSGVTPTLFPVFNDRPLRALRSSILRGVTSYILEPVRAGKLITASSDQ